MAVYEQNRIHFVHTYGDVIEGSEKICENLYCGGDFDRLNELVSLGIVDLSHVRFFLGYAGWELAQLPEELNENSLSNKFISLFINNVNTES